MKRALAPEMVHREVVGTRTGRLALSIWRTDAARVWRTDYLYRDLFALQIQASEHWCSPASPRARSAGGGGSRSSACDAQAGGG